HRADRARRPFLLDLVHEDSTSPLRIPGLRPDEFPAWFRLAADSLDVRLRPSHPVQLIGRTPARPTNPASRRAGRRPGGMRAARAALRAARGAGRSTSPSRRNGRTSGRRRHSAGDVRTSRTGWSRSRLGSPWQGRPPHAAGEVPAVEESPHLEASLRFPTDDPSSSTFVPRLHPRRTGHVTPYCLRTPGRPEKSLIPTASATRGPRPSIRWFAILM